jgi:two-component system, chemotaxis family, CheB/CheR fusion protein
MSPLSQRHEDAQAMAPVAAEPPPAGQLYIVGVGASAGGLEALERFFRAAPVDTGVVFVVIQHLSPDFKSLMDELLARHTRMPIYRVEDGMEVEPNSIYLIPPRKEMIISGGKLLLTDKDPQQDLSLPIDHFFRSLAQDAGRRAIAIVLSGTGSDGSRGIRDVHEAGGLVLAQNEQTAKFDGMPKSAVDTGIVDAALAPEEMPQVLVEFVHRRSTGILDGKFGLPDGEATHGVEAIFKLLRDEYGIDFSHYKPNTVSRRIERRLSLNQSLDLDDYVSRVRSDARELNSLYRDLLIGVTRFFRDRESFERIEKDILPDLLARKRPGEEIRFWSAACATGEEAYSMAILLHERLQLLGRPVNVKIFATDVHSASLDTAGAGVYDEDALAEIEPSRLARYFNKKQDGYHIAPEIRQMIVFARHNVIKDAPFTKIDLISCRNLLIYFQPAAQKKALSLFHFGLRTGGVLFLGPSESPGELAPEFETVDEHWKVYRKRRDIRLPPDMRLPLSNAAPHIRVTAPAPATVPFDAPLLAAYDRLLEEHMPPGLLITDQRQLVHSFGGAAQLLAQRDGRPTADILDLVDRDLRLVLAGSLQRAAKDQTPVVYTGVRISTPHGDKKFKLTVKPLMNRHLNLTHFFIALEDLGAAPAARAPAEIDANEASREQVDSLESELRHTRENLQATIEELETSNEELQASNEELVASNEELQSTNEELHSVNEELYTVNAEYQKKIAELTELTDDMDNLLRSTDIGTIFLDKDLCIRKFTPQIGRAFDLLPQDVGRRIDSFSHSIAYAGLLDDIVRVLESGTPVEKEVRHRHGNWLFLRILPYRSHTKLEGAVLTLIDISLLKRAEVRLQQLSAIVESSDDAIIGMDLEGHVTSWNHGARQLFGYEAAEVIGRAVSLLRPDPDTDHSPVDWPAEVMERMRAGESANFQVERVRRRKDGTPVDVLMSFSAIRDSDGTLVGVSTIARDISERKRAMQALAQRARISSLRADMGSILAHDEDLSPCLQQCAKSLAEGLGAACVGVWTVGGEPDVLELRAAAGIPESLETMRRIKIGELDIGRVAQERRPILTADLPHDAQLQGLEWARQQGLTAFAGYPLLVGGAVVGVLAVFCRQELPRHVLDDLPSMSYEVAQCVQRKHAEQARRLAEEEAREGVRRRDHFLAMLSHELRNPLAAVLNASSLLESKDIGPEPLEMARSTIARQSRHMARLLDDLLDVSRVTRGKIEIRRQVTDLVQTARDAVESVRPLLDSRRVVLEARLPEAPVCVDGDPARLQQIQANLLSNAIKFTPPNGHVYLTVGRENDDAVISVRDTGIGIPLDMRDRIFELFVQLDRDPGGALGGMGVGLTLVKSLVQLHGGRVTVQGEGPGKGSEFVVRLPAVGADQLPAPATLPPVPLKGLHVALVEDIADIRRVTQRLLRLMGCEVDAAEDGPAAIETIARVRPQVALIDIGLPGMDGYEVARRIRGRAELDGVKLVALTGFGQEEDRRKALDAGFDAHLVKPVDLEELRRLLCRLGKRPC